MTKVEVTAEAAESDGMVATDDDTVCTVDCQDAL